VKWIPVGHAARRAEEWHYTIRSHSYPYLFEQDASDRVLRLTPKSRAVGVKGALSLCYGLVLGDDCGQGYRTCRRTVCSA